MAYPMAKTTALDCAKAFDKCVFQRFGACEILRHDQDPRFMSQMFREYNRMMKQKQKATLSYRPQANGQQERSNKTVMQTIRLYIQDAQQKDWDEIVGRLMFAINNSYDYIRKETPHYLVHGWDAKTTLEATIPVPGEGVTRSPTDLGPVDLQQDKKGIIEDKEDPAVRWRKQVQHNYRRAMEIAEKAQEHEKKKRSARHNDSRRMKTDEHGNEAEENIREGDWVWLYINKVKPRYKKKLAQLWHGPFRVKKRTSQFSVELELPSEDGYRFFPRVHISRVKPRRLFPT
jgi:hypothetical protein